MPFSNHDPNDKRLYQALYLEITLFLAVAEVRYKYRLSPLTRQSQQYVQVHMNEVATETPPTKTPC